MSVRPKLVKLPSPDDQAETTREPLPAGMDWEDSPCPEEAVGVRLLPEAEALARFVQVTLVPPLCAAELVRKKIAASASVAADREKRRSFVDIKIPPLVLT